MLVRSIQNEISSRWIDSKSPLISVRLHEIPLPGILPLTGFAPLPAPRHPRPQPAASLTGLQIAHLTPRSLLRNTFRTSPLRFDVPWNKKILSTWTGMGKMERVQFPPVTNAKWEDGELDWGPNAVQDGRARSGGMTVQQKAPSSIYIQICPPEIFPLGLSPVEEPTAPFPRAAGITAATVDTLRLQPVQDGHGCG